MLRIVLGSLASLALLAGCAHKEVTDVASVKEQISTRPIVALVPVIDSSKCDLSWDVSEELTDALFTRLTKRDKFYLASPQKVSSLLQKTNRSSHPFSGDLSWMKQVFKGLEFVVFVELFEHVEQERINEKLPTLSANMKEVSSDLQISIRLRAVDLRSQTPQIALQEILHETHHIPRPFTRQNFYQVAWKNDAFAISPLGIAHQDLVKAITSRLEEYILRCKQG